METDQARFWAGAFGDDYIQRNNSAQLLASNLKLFTEIFSDSALDVSSFMEFGANIGMNARAIKLLFPKSYFSGVEVNNKAFEELSQVADEAYLETIEHFTVSKKFDVVFTKGVLIHINPENLGDVYEKMYTCSNKYLLVIEYYNPTPVTIEYRGNQDKLFKRDFAGEIMQRYPDVSLVKYGFAYHASSFPQDDLTWFLLEKSST